MRLAASLFPILALVLSAPIPSQEAADVIHSLSVKKGVFVVWGAGPDTLPLDLARQSDLLIYVQTDDAGRAASLRREAEAAGFLGSRVYVEKGSLDRLHLASNLADGALAGRTVKSDEILRVLRPGGKALVGTNTLTKAYPEGADEWAHPYHAPDNNPQSKDRIARGPFLSQFLSEPWYSAMPQFSVFSGGRVFKIFGERTSTQAHWESLDSFVALNAWNGTLLWRRKIPDTFMFHRNTLVATPELVYLADAESCKAFDAATGDVRDEIKVPDGISDGPVWKWMALEDGILYALVGEKEPSVEVVKGDPFRGAGWPWWKIDDYRFGFGRTVMAVDVKTKRLLWHHQDELPLDGRAMCMSVGRIFIYSDRRFLAALEQKTGKILWKTTDEKLLGAIDKHDPAQFAYKGFASTSFAKCSDKAIYFAGPTRTRIVAASAEDGKLLWQHEGGNYQLLLRPEAVYALGGSKEDGPSLKLDPITGVVLSKFGARVACTRATANSESIFVRGGRGGSTTVYDIQSSEIKSGLISPMRPACQDGVIVANGHLYWGPWICACDTTQIGVISLAPAGGFDYSGKANDVERLESGAGPATVAEMAVTDRDWPTYRKDNARSGRSPLPVPAGVVERWTYTPVERNVATAPISAAGAVYLGGSDGVVRAIDGSSGKQRWSYPTGGSIKFPPSLAEGRLYVGSGDGWVYCLEAGSGRLIWRFRAAPEERKIPVYGSLLSTWPVGSGVLVHEGVAYAAAGMWNYDGTSVFALDAVTGKIRWQNSSSGHNVLSPNSGAGVQGNLLLHDGALYLPGGQLAPIAKYDLKDGTFSRLQLPERLRTMGKDLYVIDGQITTTGCPLYWRESDSHHITVARFPAEGGHIAVSANQVGLAEPKPGPQRQPKYLWSKSLFEEYAGIAFGSNAFVVAGVDWTGKGPDQRSTGGLAALDPKDGKLLWKRALPATPVMFGVAIDRDGRILVSLQDGRVACFESAP
jgi:outer membrane protein assembly factor BamB